MDTLRRTLFFTNLYVLLFSGEFLFISFIDCRRTLSEYAFIDYYGQNLAKIVFERDRNNN